jgi:hypothetical protein
MDYKEVWLSSVWIIDKSRPFSADAEWHIRAIRHEQLLEMYIEP